MLLVRLMPFDNREQAAQLLAQRLAQYKGRRPLVLAIPRGAVPMGKVLADALDGELDVVLVRKLRSPFNPELAIGSIDETGAIYLDPRAVSVDKEYLNSEVGIQLAALRQRRRLYAPTGLSIDPAGRIVIILDDGIATGSTMIAALRSVRERRPSTLVAATAVASEEGLRMAAREADEVVCLEIPPLLYAIGLAFRDFTQVSDDDVVATLAAARLRTTSPTPAS